MGGTRPHRCWLRRGRPRQAGGRRRGAQAARAPSSAPHWRPPTGVQAPSRISPTETWSPTQAPFPSPQGRSGFNPPWPAAAALKGLASLFVPSSALGSQVVLQPCSAQHSCISASQPSISRPRIAGSSVGWDCTPTRKLTPSLYFCSSGSGVKWGWSWIRIKPAGHQLLLPGLPGLGVRGSSASPPLLLLPQPPDCSPQVASSQLPDPWLLWVTFCAVRTSLLLFPAARGVGGDQPKATAFSLTPLPAFPSRLAGQPGPKQRESETTA